MNYIARSSIKFEQVCSIKLPIERSESHLEKIGDEAIDQVESIWKGKGKEKTRDIRVSLSLSLSLFPSLLLD